ncbi:cyclase family protein [soil metagenome]
MSRRLVDLSMPVHNDMQTFPRLVRPSLEMWETWEEFATRIGAAEHGAPWLTATYRVELSDHVGTHMDARRHVSDTAPGPEGIPLEYCYGNGVLLDFSDKPSGYGITASDIQSELDRKNIDLKPLDIVLIMTGAGAYQDEPRYLTDHCGMTAEATLWLIERGIKVMGIDAVTFDPPVWAMFERKRFWESHLLMREHEWFHIENLTNLDQINQSTGFTVSVFPIQWVGTTAAPVRAVAIVEE